MARYVENSLHPCLSSPSCPRLSRKAFRRREAEVLKGLGNAVRLCTLLPLCLQSKRKTNGCLPVYCKILWGWQEKKLLPRTRYKSYIQTMCWPSFMAVHNISEKKDAAARCILRHLFLQLGNQIITWTWNECPCVQTWMVINTQDLKLKLLSRSSLQG